MATTKNKTSVDTLWEAFKDGLIAQDKVLEKFKPHFQRILYEDSLGKTSDAPYGSFLLAGPTGVGKGEFARCLARALHRDETKLLTIACNEITQDHEVAKLMGAPPGYLGHRETQPLLSQGRINSFASVNSKITIILWDEVEKASSKVFDVILNILDRGNVRLGDGSLSQFGNTINIFTTNAGNIVKPNMITGEKQGEAYQVSHQRRALERFFRPEWLGRIDDIFYFQSLPKEELAKLFGREVERYFFAARENLYHRNINISDILIPKSLQAKIIEKANTDKYGARDLKKEIKAALAISGFKTLVEATHQKPEDSDLVFNYKVSKDEHSPYANVTALLQPHENHEN